MKSIAPDALLRLDDVGSLTWVSPEAAGLFGLSGPDPADGGDAAARADALLGQEFGRVALTPAAVDSFRRLVVEAREVPAGHVAARVEAVARRGEGLAFPVELTILREEPGFAVLARDLTRRRAVEQRLLQREALLGETELIGRFGSFELDLHSGVLTASEGMGRILGMSRIPTLRSFLARFDGEEREALERAIGAALRRGERFDLRLRASARGGEQSGWLTLRLRARPYPGDAEGPPKLVATLQDISEEVAARGMRELLGYVVDASEDAILTVSAEGLITSWNRGAEALYGYGAGEALGQPAELNVPAERRPVHLAQLARVLRGESVSGVETRRLRRDGTTVEVSISLSPVSDGAGRVLAAAVVARDITERKRREARLQHLADHDPLTDLLNRRRFAEAVEQELVRARRYGTGAAVMSLDVDGLKTLNDTAGHAAGDALISRVAKTLRGSVRASDVVARLGGDEFGVLLPAGTAAQAETAAAHVLEELRAQPLVLEDQVFPIAASVGVAEFAGDEPDAEHVLAAADAAMYEAKRTGGARVVIRASAVARPEPALASGWAARIRCALDTGAMELHGQPVIELATGRLSHTELLVRMVDGEGLLVAPAAFLPEASRHGLAGELDRWVLHRAIASLAAVPADQRRPVSMNLTAHTVVEESAFPDLVERALRDAGVDPQLLIFELSEAAALANLADVGRFAERIHALGVAVAIDDFGSGLGAFRYLRHLKIDLLKLAPEFVENMTRSPVDESIVRAVVEIAHGLGVRVVAMAVPDDPTVALLREHGIGLGQGYHLGGPEPGWSLAGAPRRAAPTVHPPAR